MLVHFFTFFSICKYIILRINGFKIWFSCSTCHLNGRNCINIFEHFCWGRRRRCCCCRWRDRGWTSCLELHFQVFQLFLPQIQLLDCFLLQVGVDREGSVSDTEDEQKGTADCQPFSNLYQHYFFQSLRHQQKKLIFGFLSSYEILPVSRKHHQ